MSANAAYTNSSFHLSKVGEVSTKFQTEVDSWYNAQPEDVSPPNQPQNWPRILMNEKLGFSKDYLTTELATGRATEPTMHITRRPRADQKGVPKAYSKL